MSVVYKIRIIFANIITILCFIALPAIGHEFWIEPKKYTLVQGDILSASLFVGQDFTGYEMPYIEHNFTRFEIISSKGVQQINGRIGDRPALNVIPLHGGLSVILHQSTATYLTYNNFDKFISFAKEKGFPEIPSQHLAAKYPKTGFKESYTRFAKSYVLVRNSNGADKYSGMELEWVMENTDLSNTFEGQFEFTLYYDGKPNPNAQLSIFAKDSEGDVQKSIGKTDQYGKFILHTNPDTRYLIDSVIIRKMDPSLNPEGAIWESLWASATFKTDR